MLIAQISDTHIFERGQKSNSVAPMAENLVLVIEHINALEPRPDLVLLSGDVTDRSARTEAEHAASICSNLEVPLYIVPGNHDDRQVLANVFGPEICPMNSDGFVDYVVDDFPIRIVGLDTLDAGKPNGRISKERLSWLSDRLNEDGDKPTILFGHHPPLKLGIPETDEHVFIGAVELGKLIAKHPNIERFLCGHIHLHSNTRWCGTVVTTAPSIGMQLALDLTQKSDSKFLLSRPAYLLHHWSPDRVLVTHSISLAELEGPFEFEVQKE